MLSIIVHPALVALALVASCSTLRAQTTVEHADPQRVAHAEAVLKQAREALGGEANLKAVQSLSLSGVVKSAMMGRPTEGSLKADLLLPDKFLRSVTTSMGPMEIMRTEGVNSEEAWMDMKSSSSGGGGGGGFGGDGGFDGGGIGGGGGFGGGGRRGADPTR